MKPKTPKMWLPKWRVTMTLWRETWSGHDQNDGQHTEIVEAANEAAARRKAEKKAIGGTWSHARWVTNVVATPMSEEKMKTLKPGLYTLAVGIDNPKPDKRRDKYNWSKGRILPAGTYKVSHSEAANTQVVNLRFINTDNYETINNVLNPEVFEVLARNLKVKPFEDWTVRDCINADMKEGKIGDRLTYGDGLDERCALAYLVQKGIVKPQQVCEAFRFLDDLDERQMRDFMQQQGYMYL